MRYALIPVAALALAACGSETDVNNAAAEPAAENAAAEEVLPAAPAGEGATPRDEAVPSAAPDPVPAPRPGRETPPPPPPKAEPPEPDPHAGHDMENMSHDR